MEARFGSEVHLEDDYYWNVPLGEDTTVERGPRLDLGSVVDDAASVHEFATGDRDEDASLWHECAHIAGVLRSIARLDLSTTEGGAHSRGMAGRTESSCLDLPGGSGQD